MSFQGFGSSRVLIVSFDGPLTRFRNEVPSSSVTQGVWGTRHSLIYRTTEGLLGRGWSDVGLTLGLSGTWRCRDLRVTITGGSQWWC